MEQLLNDGWRFCKLPSSSTLKDLASAELEAVDLPHVFLVANADDLYETVDGWYSGAGIFCDVTLCVLLKHHIAPDGIYVTTSHELESRTMTIDAELCGAAKNDVLTHFLMDGDVPVCAATVNAEGSHALLSCGCFRRSYGHLIHCISTSYGQCLSVSSSRSLSASVMSPSQPVVCCVLMVSRSSFAVYACIMTVAALALLSMKRRCIAKCLPWVIWASMRSVSPIIRRQNR